MITIIITFFYNKRKINTQIHETKPRKIILSIQYKPIFKYPRFLNESAFLATKDVLIYYWI